MNGERAEQSVREALDYPLASKPDQKGSAPLASNRRSHRTFHKRYCEQHRQEEVCLCSIAEDHHERRTTVSKSQRGQARWAERVNRAHRAAWAHERNVRAWLRVYGPNAPGARTYVGTYARVAPKSHTALEAVSKAVQLASLDELALVDAVPELPSYGANETVF